MLSIYASLALGDWSDNKMHGQGVYAYASGDIYTGAFENGVKQGSGSYYFKVHWPRAV